MGSGMGVLVGKWMHPGVTGIGEARDTYPSFTGKENPALLFRQERHSCDVKNAHATRQNTPETNMLILTYLDPLMMNVCIITYLV